LVWRAKWSARGVTSSLPAPRRRWRRSRRASRSWSSIDQLKGCVVRHSLKSSLRLERAVEVAEAQFFRGHRNVAWRRNSLLLDPYASTVHNCRILRHLWFIERYDGLPEHRHKATTIVPEYVFARRQVKKPAKQARRGRG
jgi:hypothetical protein